MTTLGSTFKGGKVHTSPASTIKLPSGKSDAEIVAEISSLTAAAGLHLDTSAIQAAINQDEDAHENCSLTACLDPLHPGPCKGWKGNLFKASPGAWHALEAAKVDKANATRIKKIEALKSAGKPIPKKLLTPITAKPHPHAGQTADKASGGAHEAGKEVTHNAGVHLNAPGKVTLGQAAKSMPPVEKGPKGKKPTLASKGIAHIIGQEKVTPQYKLDKAAGITPEQWAGLPEADQSSIRGELAKIKKDGFGPQQKKADELLAKLPAGAQPTDKPTLAEVAKAHGEHTHTKVGEFLAKQQGEKTKISTLHDAKTKVDTQQGKVSEAQAKLDAVKAKLAENQAKKVTLGEATALETKDGLPYTVKTPTNIAKQVKQDGHAELILDGKPVKVGFEGSGQPGKLTMAPGGGYTVTMPDGSKHSIAKGEHVKVVKPKATTETPKAPEAPKAPEVPKTAPVHASTEAQASALVTIGKAIPGVNLGTLGDDKTKLHGIVDKMKEAGPLAEHPKMKTLVNKLAQAALKQANADNMPGIGHGSKDIGITEFNHQIRDHIAEGKPGLPSSVEKMAAHHESLKTPSKPDVPKAPTAAPKLGDNVKGPSGLTPKAEQKLAETLAKQSKVSAPHVDHAISMAKGEAPGAAWAKNQLSAYEALSADEFHGLDKVHQDKIVVDLTKAKDKFLDPKKVTATKQLLEKFGHGDAKPSAPAKAAPAVGFHSHMHDPNISDAQAKKAVAEKGATSIAGEAKNLAGLDLHDMPNALFHKPKADKAATELVESKTKLYTGAVLSQPGVVTAASELHKATAALEHAKSVHEAKTNSFNKIALKLAHDKGELTPMEKATLQAHQANMLDHPVKTDAATMTKLAADQKAAETALDEKLHAALKQANAGPVADMSPAQIKDRVKELLGEDAASPKTVLTLDEVKHFQQTGQALAASDAKPYPPEVLTSPAVAAKHAALVSVYSQALMATAEKNKLTEHGDAAVQAIMSGHAPDGTSLSIKDKQVIAAHVAGMADLKDHLETNEKVAQAKIALAKASFNEVALKAQSSMKPAEPVKLSEFDKATVSDGYANAWAKHASKAVLYGVKYSHQQDMKNHAEYPKLTEDLGQLKALAGKLALAHATAHTAMQNVPTDPSTGQPTVGTPEWHAWHQAIAERQKLTAEFNGLHKQAQARLDKIRTDVGLKKRALPKLDTAAVKATAAETGHYKSGAYSGPNYGKAESAKNFMLTKAGPDIGVKHQSALEKKSAKLGDVAAPASSTAKIKNAGEPVKLGGADASIAHVPDPLKKQITSDFKGMPTGKYLADPAADIFDNLINLAAAHGKTVPGGLSVDQVLKTIDETHSKNLGTANAGMLHKKITDWLGTADGKKYAENNSVPSAKAVKQISGELDMPDGVTLAPGQKVQTVAGPGPHDASLPASAFHPLTAAQAQASQDAHMKADGIKWSASVKSSIKSYTGSAYATYNDYLRSSSSSASPAVKQAVINIQSAMIPLQQHTLLKRGTGWPPELAAFQGDPKKLLGKTFEDKAFVSTTVAGSSGHFSGQALQLEIEAPKGTPAAFINGLSHFKGTENEMLLAAGTKFKVLSVEVKNGHTHMRVRIVGDK